MTCFVCVVNICLRLHAVCLTCLWPVNGVQVIMCQVQRSKFSLAFLEVPILS